MTRSASATATIVTDSDRAVNLTLDAAQAGLRTSAAAYARSTKPPPPHGADGPEDASVSRLYLARLGC